MVSLTVALLSCAPPAPPPTPSDDPADWPVDTGVSYQPVLGEPRFIVPSKTLIPAGATPVLVSNNNVDIVLHQGRLYFGWRTGPTHFASDQTRLHVLASDDLGQTFQYETTVYMATDMREPHFLSYQGKLLFHWFEAGTDRFSFEPKHLWRMERGPNGVWSEKEQYGLPGEITWNMKVRGGVAYRTSYEGNHYNLGTTPAIKAFFTRSTDGRTWSPFSGEGVVYQGGVSEIAYEFDENGDVWAVTRNEDGDSTGFGSHICFAHKESLGTWECSAKSDPERYDSPKMFRHGNDLYLVARRDLGGPFDLGLTHLSFADQQLQNLAAYSGRAKRTALYRLNREARKVEWLFDLPSAGDTSFPSVVRLDAHRFLIANYTSPLEGNLNRTWWDGQNNPTRLYLVELTFQPH